MRLLVSKNRYGWHIRCDCHSAPWIEYHPSHPVAFHAAQWHAWIEHPGMDLILARLHRVIGADRVDLSSESKMIIWDRIVAAYERDRDIWTSDRWPG